MQDDVDPETTLKDGGHVILSCSSCKALLLDVWLTRPQEPQTWKVKATCPWCGDASFEKSIKGGFHVGGVGKIKEDNEDDDVPSTINESFDVKGDVFLFVVKKASENARPIFRQ